MRCHVLLVKRCDCFVRIASKTNGLATVENKAERYAAVMSLNFRNAIPLKSDSHISLANPYNLVYMPTTDHMTKPLTQTVGKASLGCPKESHANSRT